MTLLTYESINQAIFESMHADKNVICFGLGADPKQYLVLLKIY